MRTPTLTKMCIGDGVKTCTFSKKMQQADRKQMRVDTNRQKGGQNAGKQKATSRQTKMTAHFGSNPAFSGFCHQGRAKILKIWQEAPVKWQVTHRWVTGWRQLMTFLWSTPQHDVQICSIQKWDMGKNPWNCVCSCRWHDEISHQGWRLASEELMTRHSDGWSCVHVFPKSWSR